MSLRDSGLRHEFLDGEAWAMAGGSLRHVAVEVNLTGLVYIVLLGGALPRLRLRRQDPGAGHRARQLDSLQHDVLISVDQPRVKVFTRGDEGEAGGAQPLGTA